MMSENEEKSSLHAAVVPPEMPLGNAQSSEPTEVSMSAPAQEMSPQIQALVDSLKMPKLRVGKQAFALVPGHVWNPLRALPRNRPCPCLSGKKFKACCLANLPLAVREADAKIYIEQMQKPDLVFMTQENEARIKAIAEAHAGARCKGCGHFISGPHDCQGPFAEPFEKLDMPTDEVAPTAS